MGMLSICHQYQQEPPLWGAGVYLACRFEHLLTNGVTASCVEPMEDELELMHVPGHFEQ